LLATVDVSGLQSTAATNTGGATNDEGDFIADLSSSTKAMTVTANTSSSHAGIINITTGTGADTITGTANNDTISSGANADTITAGAGDDEITGGAGKDTITGGSGSDDFNTTFGADGATAAVNAADVITDFTAQTAAGAAVDMISVDFDNTAAEETHYWP
jgi:Ca2+-binding RTX toxin-like protein